MYSVYVLIDPRGDHVRYVGITNNVYSRFSQHLHDRESNQGKVGWLEELRKEDLMPIIRTIERCGNKEDALSREKYWIREYLSRGAKLVNLGSRRDEERYYYVEVALPRESAAIEHMVAEAERLALPLRVLIQQACIAQYDPDSEESGPRLLKPTKRKSAHKKRPDSGVSEASITTANAFIDEGW